MGGEGNDTLGGGEGADSLYGDEGDDVIYASDDDDYVSAGDDLVIFISRPNRILLETDPLKAEFDDMLRDVCPGFLTRAPGAPGPPNTSPKKRREIV